MKYLLDKNLKVKWKGAYVRANVSKGERIFDTDDTGTSKALLKEIANNNGVVLGSKDSIAIIIHKIDMDFSKIDLMEINEMSDDARVEQIIKAGIEAGKSEDEILVEVVNTLGSFKNAVKLFKSVMESSGLKLTAKKRQEQIQELIKQNGFNPDSPESVKSFIQIAVKTVTDTNERQAYGALKRWAKGAEVKLPEIKMGKAASAVNGVRGFRAKAFGFMVDNPTASNDEFKAFVAANAGKGKKGKDRDPEVIVKNLAPIFDVAKKMAKKMFDEHIASA